MMIMTHFPEKYENLAKKVEISSFCLQTVHSMSPGNNIGNGNTINLSAGMLNSKNNKRRKTFVKVLPSGVSLSSVSLRLVWNLTGPWQLVPK